MNTQTFNLPIVPAFKLPFALICAVFLMVVLLFFADEKPWLNAELSMLFWVHLLVGIGSLFVGLWVFLVRQNWTALFYCLAGFGMALMASHAVQYHATGIVIFAFSMLALFANYPLKLLPMKYLLIYLAFSLGWLAVGFGDGFYWIAVQLTLICANQPIFRQM